MQINGFKSKAQAIRAIRDLGINIEGLLSDPESNPKVAKNGLLGVLASPLHLAPARLSGFNTCAQASKGCAAACLHTAGNPAYMAGKAQARINRTLAYFKARPAFMAVFAFEVMALSRKAESVSMAPATRPNATSDIPYELIGLDIDGVQHANIFAAFPHVSFYDYTKITKRALRHADGLMPSNYHLTYSRTESNHESCLTVLKRGGNVAMVFRKGLPDSYAGFPVINGDETDYRPADPVGCIVGLKAKGQAKADSSGFVI
jgi:hypothetical protein